MLLLSVIVHVLAVSKGCSDPRLVLRAAGVTLNGAPLDATDAGVSFVEPEAPTLVVAWHALCSDVCGDRGPRATTLLCRGVGQRGYRLVLTRHAAPGSRGGDAVEFAMGSTERSVVWSVDLAAGPYPPRRGGVGGGGAALLPNTVYSVSIAITADGDDTVFSQINTTIRYAEIALSLSLLSLLSRSPTMSPRLLLALPCSPLPHFVARPFVLLISKRR